MSAALVTAPEAVARIKKGDRLLVGGFGLVGAPMRLLEALVERDAPDDLDVVSNNLGEPGVGLGALLRQGRIARATGSYFTSNPEAAAAAINGEIDVTLIPQGTLSEALRAGGAGLGGFYTPVGAATALAEGKEERMIDGRRQVLEPPIRGDVALVYAARGDTLGNLWYSGTARNFNPAMATASHLTIAEVGELLPPGAIPPESVHTPHVYVDLLVGPRTERAQ